MTTAVDVSTSRQFKVSADDSAGFSPHRVCKLRHNFHEHPLMQLPELAELAKALCIWLAGHATESKISELGL